MSPEQTIEKMKNLRLSAMIEAYEYQMTNIDQFRDLSFDDRLAAYDTHKR